jgi:CRP/FNR family cyclic AMP-dependent transcriptional regulator
MFKSAIIVPGCHDRIGSFALQSVFSISRDLWTPLFANAKPVRLAAGEVLFIAGDPSDGCYRVEEGLLKVSIVAHTGSERILAIVGPGALVGELGTIDGLPRSASVSALRESTLTFISRPAFAPSQMRTPRSTSTSCSCSRRGCATSTPC